MFHPLIVMPALVVAVLLLRAVYLLSARALRSTPRPVNDIFPDPQAWRGFGPPVFAPPGETP